MDRTRRYTTEELSPQTCKSAVNVAALPGRPEDYLMNPKLDGFRLVCVVEHDRVDMMSRGLKWQDGKLPELEKLLVEHFPPGTVLDGEICALRDATQEERDDGAPILINDFTRVSSVMGSGAAEAVRKSRDNPLTYHCFDMMQLCGVSLVDAPLTARVGLLRDTHEVSGMKKNRHFTLVPYWTCSQRIHDAMVEAGFEGSVCKRKTSRYSYGKRNRDWFKIKNEWTMDVIIMGTSAGQGKNTGKVGAFVFGQPLEGKVTFRGKCRGFTDAVMNDATANPEKYIGKVIEISHRGEYRDSVCVRMPQFKRMRPDKTPEEITWHTM